MNRRPRILYLIAFLVMAAALSIPVQVFFLEEHNLSEWALVLQKISIFNWFVMAACGLSALLTINASPALRWAVPLSLVAVAWNNWIVVRLGADYNWVQALVAFALFAKIHGLWLHPAARKVLLKPRERWWLTPTRKKVRASIVLRTQFGECLTARLYNLSRTGIFVQFAMGDRELLSSLKEGQHVDIRILSGPLRQVQCEAEVARISGAKGVHPAGIGLRFVRCEGAARKEIAQLLQAA